jgi:hypothetical protein
MSGKTHPPRHRHRFTRDEIKHIIARYPQTTCKTIAEELGRDPESVRLKARLMQLTRTKEEMAGIYRQRVRRWWKRPAGHPARGPSPTEQAEAASG